jgi:hypothetical protein
VTQNFSSAVMQQRAEPHDSLDDFPTPPWATRALMEHVILPALGLLGRAAVKNMRSWEPCANRGFMVAPLREYFRDVVATDIFDYGQGYPVCDFLWPALPEGAGGETPGQIDWIITNPPFRLGDQIIHRARDIARFGVAVLGAQRVRGRRRALHHAVLQGAADADGAVHRARHHAQRRAARSQPGISR